MKNKLVFKLSNLVIDKQVAIDSIEITIDVDMEPEVALKNFALLADLKGYVEQIVTAIQKSNE